MTKVKPLLAVLVDGLRHDYVNQQDAPFLWMLRQEGLSGSLRETFGGQLRPAFFAGLYPNRSGVGHLFCYDPSRSPFRSARYMPAWAVALPRVGPWLKDRLVGGARAIEARRGHTASASYAYIAEIPWRYLPLFGFSEHRGPDEPGVYPSPSLFDLMRDARVRWLHVGYPYDDQATDSIVSTFFARRRGGEEFVFLHFAEVDWCGHVGPNSHERREALRRVDAAVRVVFEELARGGREPRVLVFGDHGMAEVRRVLNLYPVLSRLGLKVRRDYVFFLDSTVARFWFSHGRARDVVRIALREVAGAIVLDAEALRRYGLAGAARRLGELFCAVPAGTVLFPNFFQATAPPGGMHGYLPEDEENWASVILFAGGARGRLSEPVDLVDIFPVIVELLGLAVPEVCQGRSFLPQAHAS